MPVTVPIPVTSPYCSVLEVEGGCEAERWAPCSASRGFLQGDGCCIISQRQQDEKGPLWRAWGGLGVTSYRVAVLLPHGGRGRTLVGPVGLMSRSSRTTGRKDTPSAASKVLRPEGGGGVDSWWSEYRASQ